MVLGSQHTKEKEMNSLTMNDYELSICRSLTGHQSLPAYVRGVPRSTWKVALGRMSRSTTQQQAENKEKHS